MGMSSIRIPLRSSKILTEFQIPIVFFFFPETKGLELEDVDHLFEAGGITGGVWASRGYPVHPGHHRAMNEERIEKPIAEAIHVEV